MLSFVFVFVLEIDRGDRECLDLERGERELTLFFVTFYLPAESVEFFLLSIFLLYGDLDLDRGERDLEWRFPLLPSRL